MREKCLLPAAMADQHRAGWNGSGTEGQILQPLPWMWNLNKQKCRLEWRLPDAEWDDREMVGEEEEAQESIALLICKMAPYEIVENYKDMLFKIILWSSTDID